MNLQDVKNTSNVKQVVYAGPFHGVEKENEEPRHGREDEEPKMQKPNSRYAKESRQYAVNRIVSHFEIQK